MATEDTLEQQLLGTVADGDASLVQWLLEQGANPNARNNRGQTPLHLVAEYCETDTDMEIARLLVERGADVKAKNNNGDTPLHLAVMADDADIAELLAENGADVKAKNKQGKTPRDYAQGYAMRVLLDGAAKTAGKQPGIG